MDTGDPTRQPALLLKTLYPAPYAELVLDQARERNIDPLLFFALMRQESQFVPDARSWADARGLAQIIPSTGQGIADQLGDTSYGVNDLYVPHINIRYGTYYLASNMPQFDGKLLPTLASYNAGPGNAARWLQGSALLDPDLFSERVDLFETSDYLEIVYRNYGFYRLIYGL
jgi:soluble lytic murein transglycosylase